MRLKRLVFMLNLASAPDLTCTPNSKLNLDMPPKGAPVRLCTDAYIKPACIKHLISALYLISPLEEKASSPHGAAAFGTSPREASISSPTVTIPASGVEVRFSRCCWSQLMRLRAAAACTELLLRLRAGL